ncbi:MAG: linear amide C-N hydrolase [Clostridia bacterium]|nr:linear amide C-N hydrolase [Clostridia bacterium]
MNQTVETNIKTTGKKKKTWLWVLLIVLGILLTPLMAGFIVLYGRIATVASVQYVGQDFYTIHFQQDYKLDKLMESDISDEYALYDFLSREMFFGYPLSSANADKYACSSFLVRTPDGSYAAGRNFDYPGTEELLVYTDPADGYASYSMTDLNVIGVGEPDGLEPQSLIGKIAMLASPYLPLDGMNEKGLMVSILELDAGEIHQRTEKHDVMINVAIRLLLDRAENVEEALELLEGIDIHTINGHSHHLFICDKSGRSVVVEWRNAQMKVVENQPIVTNFWLSTRQNKESYLGFCERYDTLADWIANHPTTTYEEAMTLLDAVQQDDAFAVTEWSAVYHLNDFAVDVAVNREFDKVYHFTIQDFQ